MGNGPQHDRERGDVEDLSRSSRGVKPSSKPTAAPIYHGAPLARRPSTRQTARLPMWSGPFGQTMHWTRLLTRSRWRIPLRSTHPRRPSARAGKQPPPRFEAAVPIVHRTRSRPAIPSATTRSGPRAGHGYDQRRNSSASIAPGLRQSPNPSLRSLAVVCRRPGRADASLRPAVLWTQLRPKPRRALLFRLQLSAAAGALIS